MTAGWPDVIRPLDGAELRERVQRAEPFPNLMIENFLDPAFAHSVVGAFPSFDEAVKFGRGFKSINEKHKVQVTDPSLFPEPVKTLNQALASPSFLGLLSHAFGIPDLLADDQLVGGGLHQTGSRGRLDVHVDFNLIEDRSLHRRLNILVYFNELWQPEWGGQIELWDEDVSKCIHSFDPTFNRCLIFETSEISYHGVREVRCPPGVARRSFAAYYYTSAAPEGWNGVSHTTRFRARPEEALKGRVMRAYRMKNRALGRAKSLLKR